ncbi:MAG: type II toxin-antitoxin system VapC family toxin [Gemmatimonadota bacterium]|nr:type II toxin-antitoxin system VapC family toxin [Gemmatimonadota bacterium]
MIAVDTSVVVALFASWHEAHESAREAVPGEAHLPAHVLLESYSVLTRLPPPHRAPAAVVEAFLGDRFEPELLILPGSDYRSLLRSSLGRGISGGSVYDALIGATAKRAGAVLLTRDGRAVSTYEAVGVDFRILG